jgi:hypothetical protein
VANAGIIRGMVPRALFVILALSRPSLADDMRLDPLRSSLMQMRGKPVNYGGLRGATPQLTVVKHQLRDWIESRLPGLSQRGDEGDLERKLNSELGGGGLFCGDTQD